MRLIFAASRGTARGGPVIRPLQSTWLEDEMRRWFTRMRPSHRTPEPVPASAQARIPAPAVGDRIAFIPAQRDRRAHSAF